MKRKILTYLLILCFSAVASYAEDFGSVEIHGLLAQGFMQSSDNDFLAKTSDGTFEFNEMAINFNTELTDELRIGMQFFARDLGDLGNDEVIVDWVFADYRYKSWLGVRVGKMKSPFGLYNETRDVDMLRTSILLPQGVYNEGWRDSLASIKGTGLYGYVPLSYFGGLSYNIQTGVKDINPDGGIGKFAMDQGDLTVTSVDRDIAYISAVTWETPLEGLRFGATYTKVPSELLVTTNEGPLWKKRSIVAGIKGTNPGMSTEVATVAADTMIAGAGGDIDAVYTASFHGTAADLVGINLAFPLNGKYSVYSAEYVWNDLTLAYEYALQTVKYNLTSSTLGAIVPDTSLDVVGWYGSASYRFTELFELGLYYSEFYPDADDKRGTTLVSLGYPKEAGHSRDWCLSTRFDINEYWVIKAEGHMIDGLAVMFMKDQKTTATGYDVDDEWFLGAVKISYSF